MHNMPLLVKCEAQEPSTKQHKGAPLPAALAPLIEGGQVMEATTLLAEALQAPLLHRSN